MYIYIRVAPKNWKLCDSGQMMGEVIIKLFYSYYFWFHQPYAPAMPKIQNQKIRSAHKQIFSWSAAKKACRWNLYFFSQMENYVIHMRIKISENPRKGFFTIAGLGGWTKFKNEYIFELYITQASFCPVSWNFTTTRSGDSCFFWATLLYILYIR